MAKEQQNVVNSRKQWWSKNKNKNEIIRDWRLSAFFLANFRFFTGNG